MSDDPILVELREARIVLQRVGESIDRVMTRRRKELSAAVQATATKGGWQCRRCHLWWHSGTPVCRNCALDRTLHLPGAEL